MSPERSETPENLLTSVAEKYGLKVTELRSESRRREVVKEGIEVVLLNLYNWVCGAEERAELTWAGSLDSVTPLVRNLDKTAANSRDVSDYLRP